MNNAWNTTSSQPTFCDGFLSFFVESKIELTTSQVRPTFFRRIFSFQYLVVFLRSLFIVAWKSAKNGKLWTIKMILFVNNLHLYVLTKMKGAVGNPQIVLGRCLSRRSLELKWELVLYFQLKNFASTLVVKHLFFRWNSRLKAQNILRYFVRDTRSLKAMKIYLEAFSTTLATAICINLLLSVTCPKLYSHTYTQTSAIFTIFLPRAMLYFVSLVRLRHVTHRPSFLTFLAHNFILYL